MNDDLPRKKINFTLTESAQNHLLKVLPKMTEILSERGLDLAFIGVGSGRAEKDGKVMWEYKGPYFGFGGRKPDQRTLGASYELLGYTVWMSERDTHLLDGRVLTFKKVGSPEPQEELVIENVPDDYFQRFGRENSGGCSCGNPHGKQGGRPIAGGEHSRWPFAKSRR